MSAQVKPMPVGEELMWNVKVDGETVSARHIQITHPKFGTLSWGKRPEGSQGWMWEEVGGGGTGIVSYVVISGLLYVGLIQEERFGMFRTLVWNIPRGFLDPQLTPLANACQEWVEEVGAFGEPRISELEGEPANPNSTFFDTSKGGGFHYFGLEIKDRELVCDSDGFYRFKDRVEHKPRDIGEKILNCRFFPWSFAAQISDGFSNSGVARLLTTHEHLRKFI